MCPVPLGLRQLPRIYLQQLPLGLLLAESDLSAALHRARKLRVGGEAVLPVPGVVVVAAWVAVVVIAKLLLGKAYVPYSILMVSSLIQIVQILVLLIVLSSAETSSSSTTISRLLVGMDYSYRIKIYSLLLASLVLSYVMNILFLYISADTSNRSWVFPSRSTSSPTGLCWPWLR